MPHCVDRKPEQRERDSGQRGHWAGHERVANDPRRPESKDERHHWIARRAVGPRQLGASPSKQEHADRREGEERPDAEDERLRQLSKLRSQTHVTDTIPNATSATCGVAKARMHAGQRREEQTVPRHRVEDPGLK